jgi:sarcosine oxidase subunit beta
MPDFVIIGAGVVGTSIAFHLAKAGCRDVVVLERSYIGSGSTEKCPGGIRQQFAGEANIRLSMESVRFYGRFLEETGHVADFRQRGYVILAGTAEEMDTFRENVRLQRRLGLGVVLLAPDDVADLVPALSLEGVLGATFCPTDGYADPYSVVSGFASAAKRMGVRIIEDTEVTGLIHAGGRVRGVVTPGERLEAPVVIDAAGPYAAVVAGMAGVSVPVSPVRRHVFITEPVFSRGSRIRRLGKAELPMVIDFHTGFWFRPEGACIIFGMRNPEQPPGFDIDVDWSFLTDTLAAVACRRLPVLDEVGITRAQAGLHADTPDRNAILGEAPGVRGLYLACGFSGHGFMHAPAVGRLMADLVMGKTGAAQEAAPFRPDRFRDGEAPEAERAFI